MPDRLTLQQKASLLSGADFWSTKGLPEHDVASLVLTDGPHGVRHARADAPGGAQAWSEASLPSTCFPPAVAVACSWDTEVARQTGEAVGREALSQGVGVLLGPGVNIKRSPLCGRNFEYYSEDPLLTGVLATAYVQALEAQGVGASVKHFAANNQETERMRISADVDERTLREIYLPAFERVIAQGKPATVMAAYNKVNGVPACEDPWLLTRVLRDEWGYEGVVVSDWNGINDRVAALCAGLDLQMPGSGGGDDAAVVAAVQNGELEEQTVDRSVRRLLKLAQLAKAARVEVDLDQHHALARRLAADCAVLLKNAGGVLPLAPATRIAVIGEFAASPRFQGGGSSHVNATRTECALDAIRTLAGTDIAYAPGFATDGSEDAALLAGAVELARGAEVAVVFAGLWEADESEGFDRTHLDLPAPQVDVIRAVAAVAPRTVVVLSHGGVVTLEGWHDDVDAIMDGFLLGQAGGAALADLLYGVVNPSGHLAESIPLRLQDTPTWMNFPGEEGHVRYGEGVLVGYRYYVTADVPVRYPFGHGLSYTAFTTSDVDVRTTSDDTAEVTVTVTNTGVRRGKHVVQVYVATQAGDVRRPARELRAFAKVELEPGMSATLTLPLDRRAFAHWSTRREAWVVPGGEYRVQVCADSERVLAETAVTLVGDSLTEALDLDSTVEQWFTHPVVAGELLRGMGADEAMIEAGPGDWLPMVGSLSMRRFITFPGIDLTPEDLSELAARSREQAR